MPITTHEKPEPANPVLSVFWREGRWYAATMSHLYLTEEGALTADFDQRATRRWQRNIRKLARYYKYPLSDE